MIENRLFLKVFRRDPPIGNQAPGTQFGGQSWLPDWVPGTWFPIGGSRQNTFKNKRFSIVFTVTPKLGTTVFGTTFGPSAIKLPNWNAVKFGTRCPEPCQDQGWYQNWVPGAWFPIWGSYRNIFENKRFFAVFTVTPKLGTTVFRNQF